MWGLDGRVLLRQVKGHVLHEPLERFTMETVTHGLLLGHVPGIDLSILRTTFVEELGVFVHPHDGNATVVLLKTNMNK